MAGDNETYNKQSGHVGGHNFQFGTVYGSPSIWIGSSERRNLNEEQESLLRSLAGQVRSASDRELSKWGIRDRDALPVRWHTAPDNLVDHPEKIHGSADPVPLDGRFTKILDTYEAVPSKRLVILGEAGAGKTVLSHRLILGLLQKRETGHHGPVPVLFSLGSWNPTETELPHWLAQQLIQDFPYLEASDPTTKTKQAELFVGNGLILPILDGFDEISEHHHANAIKKIGTLNQPLILTSRRDEYATAARGIKAVSGAAAITLNPLTLDEARDYLCHTTSKDRAPAWNEVFELLSTAPGEPVSQNLTTVLTTPLMAVLARTVYNDETGRTPLDLLDIRGFPTRTAVEDHLLDAYLTTVYAHVHNDAGRPRRPNWNPKQARRWLGYLATHLHDRNTHDLTWWHLPANLHRRTRILVTTAVPVLIINLVFMLGGMEVLAGVIPFALGGVIAAVIINEIGYRRGGMGHEPERLRLILRRQGFRASLWPSYLKKSASAFVGGLIFGLVIGVMAGLGDLTGDPYINWRIYQVAVALSDWLPYEITYSLPIRIVAALVYGITDWLPGGLILGSVLGIVSIVVSVLGDPHDRHIATPWVLLARDRSVTLIRTITTIAFMGCGLGILALGFGSPNSMYEPADRATEGLIIGLIWGLFFGIVRIAFSAWGNWLLFARLWLPLTRCLPWRPKRFLEDAHARGVLRTVGAVYQFRHVRLRDHLAKHY